MFHHFLGLVLEGLIIRRKLFMQISKQCIFLTNLKLLERWTTFKVRSAIQMLVKRIILFIFRLLNIILLVPMASQYFTGNRTDSQSAIYSLLKACVPYFCQIFISHQMIALQKLWKMFFISSKSLFLFSRYSSFCISVFPSFSPCQPLL